VSFENGKGKTIGAKYAEKGLKWRAWGGRDIIEGWECVEEYRSEVSLGKKGRKVINYS